MAGLPVHGIIILRSFIKMIFLKKCYRRAAFVMLACAAIPALAQDTLPATRKADTLREITVTAYGQNSSLRETPAAVSVIGSAELSRYNTSSILPAINTAPGVRMEERSPGSYRFGIRGSSLESPFGVRNVKVYYNDIPLTDPGGGTYLNQLGYYNVQAAEIIKGPGSSLYGAGTGGVLLLRSLPQQPQPGITMSYTGGSYGLSNAAAEIHTGDSASQNIIRYQHLTADGYRAQSRTRRDVASWDATLKHTGSLQLSAHFLYGNLYYQTPGALTKTEYDTMPGEARPASGASPGAAQINAGIYQQMALAGFTAREQFSAHWDNTTTLYANYSSQLNPNLRNYSRVAQPHFGGRTAFGYNTMLGAVSLQWITGAELQQGFEHNSIYKDTAGNAGALQTEQEINNRQLFGFTQLSVAAGRWRVSGGASLNAIRIALQNFYPAPSAVMPVTFNNELAPRLAVLYDAAGFLSVFAAVEKGFSPPTTDELAPTGSAVNLALKPEHGWNYEAGFRGAAFKNRLTFDVTFFYFHLHDGLVQRRDSAGGDYYLNAGSTNQSGAEAAINYRLLAAQHTQLNAWLSYTGFHFRYGSFMELGADYSGNRLPGSAPNTVAAGLDAALPAGFSARLTYFYSDAIPLNDANTATTKGYHLLGARIDYQWQRPHAQLRLFAGGDNLLNATYSLGNDINAAGGRYYNAAAGINAYAGIAVSWLK